MELGRNLSKHRYKNKPKCSLRDFTNFFAQYFLGSFLFQIEDSKAYKTTSGGKKKPKEWKAISKNNKWHKNLLFTDESPKKVVHPICRQSLFHFILSFFLPFFPPFSHYFSFTLLYSYNMGIRNRIHSFFFCFNGDAKRNRWLQNFFHITELFNIQLLKQHCLILTLASKRIIGKRFGSKNFIIEPRVRLILSLSLSPCSILHERFSSLSSALRKTDCADIEKPLQNTKHWRDKCEKFENATPLW